jgi:hypothetical protein
MDRKEQAIKLAESVLNYLDEVRNPNLAGIYEMSSADYILLYEAVENGWISDRFNIHFGLRMEEVLIFAKDDPLKI